MEKVIKYILSYGYNAYSSIEAIETTEDFLGVFFPREVAVIMEMLDKKMCSLADVLTVAQEIHEENKR